MAQRPVRHLMEAEMLTEDLRLIKIAGENRKNTYDQAYYMFEWGREWFTNDGLSLPEQIQPRESHYRKLELEFQEQTKNRHSIRRYTGSHVAVFDELCANPRVVQSAEASIAE